MKIEKRLKQLEKKLKPTKPWCVHTIFIDPDGSQKEAVEKYKAKNEVGPDDEFTIIQFVAPKERIKNETK